MTTTSSLLTNRKASEWMRAARVAPVPEMLFGEFWLEGELSIMFGDAGAGKSLLAVQVAQAIASGSRLDPIREPSKPRQVLYFDLELTAKQFEMRYSREREADGPPGRQFQFSGRFSRVEVDLTAEVPEEFPSLAEYLGAEIERMVDSTGAKVLIVDNINCLKRKYESIREALPLMAALHRMKRRYGLSILVLAHTPRRMSGRPIDISDMPGARVLSNYADNVFAVSMSRMYPDARYLKQITPKNTARIFGENTVPTFFLQNLYGDFLGFRFLWFATEHDHLTIRRERSDWEIIYRVRRLSDEGMTIREIAGKLNRSRSAIHRILHMLPRPEPPAHTSQNHLRERVGSSTACQSTNRTETHTSPVPNSDNETRDFEGNDDLALAATEDAVDRTSAELANERAEGPGQNPLRKRAGSFTTSAAELGSETAEGLSNETLHKQPGKPVLELEYNDYGKELWVESRDEQGKRMVWYYHDLYGRRFRCKRNAAGIYITPVESAPDVDTS